MSLHLWFRHPRGTTSARPSRNATPQRGRRTPARYEALETRQLLAADLSDPVGAIRHADLFTTELPQNDDGYTDLLPIGFNVNFFGREFNNLYVNNNGNVSFDRPLYTFTPFSLLTTEIPLLAPFFADVDTRGTGSDLVRYGQGVIDGRKVFGVNWIDVGYYENNTDKLNSFQLIITSRSDVAAGDFDFEFNYDRLLWETGDASDGEGGLGGSSARAGWSNGTTRSRELPGSAVNGALLDNGPNSLVTDSFNSAQPGRYVFEVRSGVVADPPTLTIGTNKGLLSANESAELSFTLSHPSATFTIDDIVTTGGTLSSFTGAGANYTALFTPTPGFVGKGTVRVPAGVFTNAGGTTNLVARLQPGITIDAAAPTVAVTSSRSMLRATQTATITFTLSEPSTTFGLDDVAVTGGTLSHFNAVGGSQTTYRARFTPTSDFTGAGTVRVAAGKFSDLVGNLNAVESALTPAIDVRMLEAYSLIEATRDGAVIDMLMAGQAADIAFSFAEPVVGFTAGDVVVTGGTLTDFAGSGQFYTARFTPRANSTAAGTVSIPAGRFTDAAGNPNSLLQLSPSIPINTVVPAMSISQRLPVLKAGQSATVTFQIRGTVNNAAPFTTSDITLAPGQGTLSPLTDRGVARGIHTYTAIYTAPADSFAGPVLLTVPADSFRIVGNAFNSNAATSLKINVDAQGPRPVISTTATATGLKSGQTAVVDFTIANETANVVGFDAADVSISSGVSLSSGSIGKPTRVPGTTIYRATYTPAPDFEGTVTIALPAGTFTDAVGNPNTAASTITIDVDTLAPAAPTVSLVSDTGSSSTDKTTSDARLQTPGTEPNATVQFWSNIGLTNAWTGPRTGVNTLWATQTDTAGNRSSATPFEFQYYATGPIVSAFVPAPASTGLRAGAFLQLSVRFDRPVFVTGHTTDRPFITIGGFTTGASTRNAVYSSGSGTTTLVFRYRVVAGDKAPTGITFPSTAITLEAAALADAAGNAATLGFTLPSRRPLTRVNA